jgi:Chaperone of endosialidase
MKKKIWFVLLILGASSAFATYDYPPLEASRGGTAQTTIASAFSSFYETVSTALGDLVYGGSSGAPTRLAGNTSATTAVLTQTGNGSVSAAPVWTTSTGTGSVVFSSSPTIATPTIGSIINVGNNLNVEDSTDNTKVMAFNASNNTTGKTLTVVANQTNSEQINFPNITANDTLAALGLAQTFSAANTFSAAGTALTVTNNATISGTLTEGNIKNASNVLNIEDSTDTTKIIALNASGNTTGKKLTISSGQTNSETLTIPNITASDTLATLGLAQTFSGATVLSSTLGVGTSPSATRIVSVNETSTLNQTVEMGLASEPTFSSSATTSIRGFHSGITQAASITTSAAYNYFAGTTTKGAGSTITNLVDFYSGNAENHPASNNAVIADNTSFTGNWFINQSGTDNSTFGGQIATTANTAGVLVKPSTSTNLAYLEFTNSGNGFVGLESSTGGSAITGTSAYEMFVSPGISKKFAIGYNNGTGIALEIDTSGNVFIPQTTTGTNADFLCMASTGQILRQTTACTISSRRFKENIESLSDGTGLEDVMALHPVQFNMKKADQTKNPDVNGQKTQTGLIAEEVEKVDPRLAVYEQDGKTPKSYRQEAVISVLIKAIQEQQAEIELLKKACSK